MEVEGVYEAQGRLENRQKDAQFRARRGANPGQVEALCIEVVVPDVEEREQLRRTDLEELVLHVEDEELVASEHPAERVREDLVRLGVDGHDGALLEPAQALLAAELKALEDRQLDVGERRRVARSE